MSGQNLSPIAVVKFSRAYLLDLIRHLTGWDQRSEVSDKIQLNYLCDYLESDHIRVKTIVVETEYIDRHYLEDYSEYYARCFPSHPRKCARLHFFSDEFDEATFISALEANEKKFISRLNKHYLGYVVIRPIPHTFLAKVCLIRYPELAENKHCTLIAAKNEVSLFGIHLSVIAAPFLEQDKVVSVCATSALWMFFNSTKHNTNGNLPSPSAITKSATDSQLDGARTFPSAGLSPTQVARSLKHFGFEPLIFNITEDYLELREILYGYIKSDIPVLIAGSIYQKGADGLIKHLGDHLVCALGFRLSSDGNHGSNLVAHNIEKIYVHDDRYGPYIRVSMAPIQFTWTVEGESSVSLAGLEFSRVGSDTKDYFVPDLAIVGVYHKIRLTYFEIRAMCLALYSYLDESRKKIEEVLRSKQLTEKKQIEHFNRTGSAIGEMLNGHVDITLTTNTRIKAEVQETEKFLTYCGSLMKSSCLLQSMPKYMWRCRVTAKGSRGAQIPFTDILFDATEVAQGQVIVGYISYSGAAEEVWKYSERAVCNNTWASYQFHPDIKQGISGFLKFFQKNKNKSYLNSLYGFPGLPRRNIKPGEADQQNNFKIRKDVLTIRIGDNSVWSILDKSTKYIWVINEFGDLVIGEDIEDFHANINNQGHPTLVDGRPARLGGELYFSTRGKYWIANLRSGTYSSHLPIKSKLRYTYLCNVIKHNFSGLSVKVEKGELPS